MVGYCDYSRRASEQLSTPLRSASTFFSIETCLVSGNCAVQEIHGQWRTDHSEFSYSFHRRYLPECSVLSERQNTVRKNPQ